MAEAHTAQPPTTLCQGTSANGKPCTRRVQAGATYCHGHDPARAADRSLWTVPGGRATSNQSRALKQATRIRALGTEDIGDLPGVRTLVHQSIGDVISGKIDPAVASAVANLAKTYQILDAAVKDEELARELAELKALAEERGAA